MSWTVKPMQPEDLAVCAAIEQHAPDPWTEAQMAEELSFEGARLFVVRQGDAIAGLAAFQLAADEASLNTVTIDPAFRRQGAARALLCGALEALKTEGAAMCFLEVRSRNAPALALYDALGFSRAGLRKRFFTNPPDDAIVMNKLL